MTDTHIHKNLSDKRKDIHAHKEGETTNDLYTFLATEPNKEADAIHPKP